MAEDSAPVPRVMLITTHPPGSAGVGGIFLGDLCLLYPEHSICCFAVTEGKSTKINPALEWLPIRYANLPRQHGFRRLGAGVERLTAPLARQFARTNSIPALAEQAVAFGRQHNVNLVWAVLEHPALFELVERVV